MENDNNHDAKNSLITILLLVLLTTGSLIPLISSRPYDPQLGKVTLVDEQKADARLWQDPIAAVERHINQINQLKSTKPDPRVSSEAINVFRDKIAKKINGDLRIIAVSVFGNAYSETVEFRQRYRY